jgi:hypothetical protein
MSDVQPTQFFEAGIIISNLGLQIPCLAGAGMDLPENFLIPSIIGNRWRFNRVRGLTQPVIDMPICLRDRSDEALSSTFLNWCFGRTNDSAYNTPEIPGGIVFFDGADAWLCNGVKFDSFTLTVAKGELLGFNARFIGTDAVPTSAPAAIAWDNTPPLNYESCTFPVGSGFEDEVWQFGMSYSNNLIPNYALNGKRGPKKQNAGSPTAGFNIRTMAKYILPADDSTVPMVITGNNVTRTFTLNRVACGNRNSRKVEQPHVMRNYTFECLGGDSRTIGPLTAI